VYRWVREEVAWQVDWARTVVRLERNTLRRTCWLDEQHRRPVGWY